MLSSETKQLLRCIVEIIEDKDFPARRYLTDYVVLLLPGGETKEAEKYIEGLYDKADK